MAFSFSLASEQTAGGKGKQNEMNIHFADCLRIKAGNGGRKGWSSPLMIRVMHYGNRYIAAGAAARAASAASWRVHKLHRILAEKINFYYRFSVFHCQATENEK